MWRSILSQSKVEVRVVKQLVKDLPSRPVPEQQKLKRMRGISKFH